MPKRKIKPAVAGALAELRGILDAAKQHGITITVRRFQRCKRHRPSHHWMFDAGILGRVLDWWPATGTWRTDDGRTGTDDGRTGVAKSTTLPMPFARVQTSRSNKDGRMTYQQLIHDPIHRLIIPLAIDIYRAGALTVSTEGCVGRNECRVVLDGTRIRNQRTARVAAELYATTDKGKHVVVLLDLLTLGAFFADGAHIVSVDPDGLQSLDHMDIALTAAEYHQPFHTVGIESGDDFFIVHWNPAAAFSTILHPCPGREGNDLSYFAVRPDETFDGALIRSSHGLADSDYTGPSLTARRSLLNLCLLATHHGLRKSPSDPESYRHKATQRLGKSIKRGADSLIKTNALEVATIPFRFELDQHVSLFRSTYSTDRDAATDSTGRLMPPHWRRGHWRKQRHGAGNQQTKLIPIPAVLVNADLLLGDRANSRVTYSAQEGAE